MLNLPDKNNLLWTHWVAPIEDVLMSHPKAMFEFVIVATCSISFYGYTFRVIVLDVHGVPNKEKLPVVGDWYYTKTDWMKKGTYIPIEAGSTWRHFETGLDVNVVCTKNYPKIDIISGPSTKILPVDSKFFQTYAAMKGNRCLPPSFL